MVAAALYLRKGPSHSEKPQVAEGSFHFWNDRYAHAIGFYSILQTDGPWCCVWTAFTDLKLSENVATLQLHRLKTKRMVVTYWFQFIYCLLLIPHSFTFNGETYDVQRESIGRKVTKVKFFQHVNQILIRSFTEWPQVVLVPMAVLTVIYDFWISLYPVATPYQDPTVEALMKIVFVRCKVVRSTRFNFPLKKFTIISLLTTYAGPAR